MKYLNKTLIFLIIFNFALSSSSARSVPGSFADLAEKLTPSVVNISTTRTMKTSSNDSSNNNPFRLPPGFSFPPGHPFNDLFPNNEGRPETRRGAALGSGFIIKDSGIVVTNNHVIEDAEDIIVRVGDKEYKSEIIGADPLMDVAVLKMNTNEKFIPVKFGDSSKARVGDWVVAIGNPFGLGGTVTSGIISARNRQVGITQLEDFIQTDASINVGNSGGPLFNLKGEVIGINTAIIAPGQSGSIGIGFAIPSNAASNVIDQLIEFGETKRGWLGVRIQEVSKEIAEVEKLKKPEGALVSSVGKNSPADKSGIKAGDIILEFDGKKITTMKKLPNIVASTEVGKNVELKVWRNKKLITKRLTLGRLETSEQFKETKVIEKENKIDSLKISVRDITKEDISSRKLDNKTSGVIITKILDKSPLIDLLNINDIIIEVQKTPIKNSSDLNKIVNRIFKRGKKTLMLTTIDKNNQRNYLGIKIN